MTSRLLKPSLGSPDYDGIRAALRRDTSEEVLAVRGITVRVDTPPLFRRGDEHQAVRVSADGNVPNGLTFALKDGGAVVDEGTYTLFVPEPKRYTLEVRD